MQNKFDLNAKQLPLCNTNAGAFAIHSVFPLCKKFEIKRCYLQDFVVFDDAINWQYK
jgi:hypothetical protein